MFIFSIAIVRNIISQKCHPKIISQQQSEKSFSSKSQKVTNYLCIKYAVILNWSFFDDSIKRFLLRAFLNIPYFNQSDDSSIDTNCPKWRDFCVDDLSLNFGGMALILE